jgi:hypothetical protein
MNFVKTTYQGKDVDLGCAHWRSFPPRALAVAPDHSPEDMRAKKIIDEPEYQRFKVWQSVCNLTAIEPEKCLQCPHARIAGFPRPALTGNQLPAPQATGGRPGRRQEGGLSARPLARVHG